MDKKLKDEEIIKKLDQMREDAILELHKYDSVKGKGFIVNLDGTIYDYDWFLGFNNTNNSFGMCNNLSRRERKINCEELKSYLQNELKLFDNNDNKSFDEEGYDIIIKIGVVSKYYNDSKLYEKIFNKIIKLGGK